MFVAATTSQEHEENLPEKRIDRVGLTDDGRAEPVRRLIKWIPLLWTTETALSDLEIVVDCVCCSPVKLYPETEARAHFQLVPTAYCQRNRYELTGPFRAER